MQDHSIHDLYFAEVVKYLAACVQLPHCRQQVEVSPDSSSVQAVQQLLCVGMQATHTCGASPPITQSCSTSLQDISQQRTASLLRCPSQRCLQPTGCCPAQQFWQ